VNTAKFHNEDIVKHLSTNTIRKVKQYHSGTNKYQVQTGSDGTAIEWVAEEDLELVQKYNQSDGGPGFVPDSSLMGR
jgi:hypothetical protein